MALLNLSDNDITNVLVALRSAGQHALAERVEIESHDAEDDAEDEDEHEDPDPDLFEVDFADPDPRGGSALRRATKSNPRVHSCPTCGRANVLTTVDVGLGYQCDSCADAQERGGY